MNACRFFLLTSLAFPYIKKSFQYQSLNSQSKVVHIEEGKEKPAMAHLFIHLLIPNQKEYRAVLKFVLFWAVQQDCLHQLCLIGFQTRRLLEPLPFVTVCLHHLCACLTSCCMCRVIWAQSFQACLCNPCSCQSFVSFCICSANHFVRPLSTNVSILVFVYAAKTSPVQTFQFDMKTQSVNLKYL